MDTQILIKPNETNTIKNFFRYQSSNNIVGAMDTVSRRINTQAALTKVGVKTYNLSSIYYI